MGEAAMEEREAMEEKTIVARVPLDLPFLYQDLKSWWKAGGTGL
jgi:hypothetical protein